MKRAAVAVSIVVFAVAFVSAMFWVGMEAGDRAKAERARRATPAARFDWNTDYFDRRLNTGTLHLREGLGCDLEDDPAEEGARRWPPGSPCEAIFEVAGVKSMMKMDPWTFQITKAELFTHEEIEAGVLRALGLAGGRR